MAYFDVKDEAGASIPLLTRQENARLTGAILVAAARGALTNGRKPGEESLGLDPGLIAYLATIPTQTPQEGRALLRAVLNPGDQIVYPEKRVGEIILADEDFRNLLGLCASCSFIHIPVVASPGERRIVKIGLMSPWDAGVTGRRRGSGSFKRRLGRISTWLGWRAEARMLFMPHVGNAQSFHVQISAPERVEFTEAGMRNKSPAELVKADAALAPPIPEPPTDDPTDAVGYQQLIGGIRQRKHLYISPAGAHRAGIVWVRCRVVRHGFLRAAVAVAWLVTGLLTVFAIRADNIVGDSQTSAALLLLVPALIASFLIAPGEHDLTRHLLRGPRLLTAFIGFLSLLATAALLALPEPSPRAAPNALVCTWAIEAVVAFILTCLITVSLFLPRAGHRDKSSPPADHDQTLVDPHPEEHGVAGGNV